MHKGLMIAGLIFALLGSLMIMSGNDGMRSAEMNKILDPNPENAYEYDHLIDVNAEFAATGIMVLAFGVGLALIGGLIPSEKHAMLSSFRCSYCGQQFRAINLSNFVLAIFLIGFGVIIFVSSFWFQSTTLNQHIPSQIMFWTGCFLAFICVVSGIGLFLSRFIETNIEVTFK